jgi:hypothetical protein
MSDRVRVELRDGSRVIVRPVGPDDRDAIDAGYRRLSEDSRYSRFFTVQEELTDSQLHYLTEIDHHDHEALIARDEVSGEGVGIARFVRLWRDSSWTVPGRRASSDSPPSYLPPTDR